MRVNGEGSDTTEADVTTALHCIQYSILERDISKNIGEGVELKQNTETWETLTRSVYVCVSAAAIHLCQVRPLSALTLMDLV